MHQAKDRRKLRQADRINVKKFSMWGPSAPVDVGASWKVALYTEEPGSIKMRACIPLAVFGPI